MLTAKNATSGLRAGALNDIKTTIYGLVSNANKFPTCDGNKMSAMKSDSFCPKKALIATGPVKSILGDPTLTGRRRAVQPVPARVERRPRQAVVLLHHWRQVPVRHSENR